MSTLDLARWQFAITIVYHFVFVPLTIGLAFLVAILQTAAYRTNRPEYDRAARFFGRLFLINFAMGVVTGIVQEFQFGMNWSSYSQFVGNIFGAPLAIEGLLAFFMESTFIGLWIFGRDRLSARLHLSCIWLVSVGTMLSALFILGANAWMQHPVGYRVDPATHQAVMTNFWAVMGNSTLWVSFFHTVLGAWLTAAVFMLGISAWHLARRSGGPTFARAARVAVVVSVISSLGVAFSGHLQGQVMTKQQPMKMAAAEALYNTEKGADFSLLTIGNLSGQPLFQLRLPHMLSVLADNSWNGTVEGINQVQAQEAARYGPGDYRPTLWITYWTFRIMVGAGFLLVGLAGWGLWLMRRGKLELDRWYHKAALWAIPLPFIANTTGWIFTEMGRQPWVVYGLLRTSNGVSPAVSTGEVAATLIGFVGIYTLLAIIDVVLMLRYAKTPRLEGDVDDTGASQPDLIPGLVY
ncbi:MAG TPA: cytochrome ubiquinol oxidase subunit I [Acidimicrobiales bacterium]|nr:cytochrome ubiquinol oxidase subunit I [Acidimicrobiales bacterium]